MAVLVTLLAIAVGLLGVLVAGLLRSHAEVLRALHDMGVVLDPGRKRSSVDDLPTRSTASGEETSGFDLVGTTVEGGSMSLAVRGTERLTLLAFLSSTCLTCRSFWDAFAAPDLEVPGGARLVAVAKGPEAESPSALRDLAPPNVTTILSSEAWEAYGVPVAPYFVLIDGSTGDVVGEGAATSWPQVRNLMEQSMADAGIADDRAKVREGELAATGRAQRGRAAREARVDEQLKAAGIEPGHPSLYAEDDA
jgi:hypothetical protein